MTSLSNFNYNIDIYDCCLWYGSHNTNTEVNSDLELLSGYTQMLKEKFKGVKLFLNNLYSVFYDPVEGDNLLETVLKTDKETFFGTLIFPAYFIKEKQGFEKYLDNKIRSGFKIIRLMPKTHKYLIDEWAFSDFFKIIKSRCVPVIINIEELDITGNKQINWKYFYDFSEKYPDITIILDGGNAKEMVFSGYLFQLLQNTGNIYLNTHNLLAFNQLEDIALNSFADRLLFDSYLPYYPETLVLDRINNARIKNEDKTSIFAGNMQKIIDKIIVK